MEGFLDIRAPTATHCRVTRVVNISPEMIIISAIGRNDMTIFLNIYCVVFTTFDAAILDSLTIRVWIFGHYIACVPAVFDIHSGICQRKPANSPTYYFLYWQGFLLKRWTISMMKDNRRILLMSMKRTFAHSLLPNFEQGKLI
jgi:hypothetical protein